MRHNPLFKVGDTVTVYRWHPTTPTVSAHVVCVDANPKGACQSGVMYLLDEVLRNQDPNNHWIDEGWLLPDHEVPEEENTLTLR